MPDQRSGDGPDYGWLYGGRQGDDQGGAPGSRDVPSSDDPEPTRVMPTMGRGRDSAGAAGAGAGTGNRERAAAAYQAHEPAQRRVAPAEPVAPPRSRQRRRRVPVGRIVLLVLLAWIVFLVAVPIWAVSKIDKVDITPAGDRPGEQPGTTYLLVGSDSRKGLSRQEKRKLSAGGVTESGQRTDTIMLLHTGGGSNVLLSIPRDSLVPIPGHGTTKINAAFAFGGPKLLTKTIEQNTGVRVDHYVEIGFGGFVNTVDAVGGITICPKTRLDDRRSGLHVKKGCQEVDGITALAYSRDRHSFKSLGDVQRAANQRQVVSAVGSKVKSPWTFLNPVRYYNLNRAATTSIRVSNGTGPVALGKFGLAMAGTDQTCTVPIADLAVHWDRDRALKLFGRIKRDEVDNLPRSLCSESGLGR